MASTTADHAKQSSSRRVIFFVASKMLCKHIDLVGEAGDLDLRRTSIVVTLAVFFAKLLLHISGNGHNIPFIAPLKVLYPVGGVISEIGNRSSEAQDASMGGYLKGNRHAVHCFGLRIVSLLSFQSIEICR